MEELPPICTGGIVEYIAQYVKGLNWQGISAHCSLSQTDLILLLCILCLSFAVLCVFLLSDLFVRRQSSTQRRSHLNRPSPNFLYATGVTLPQRIFSMNDLLKPFHRGCVMELQPFMSPEKAGPNDPPTSSATVTDSAGPPKSPASAKTDANGTPTALHSPRKSRPVNVLSLLLLVSAALALLVGAVCTCLAAQRIGVTVYGLSGHVEESVSSSKLLAKVLISESYAIMNGAIREDVAQNNPRSCLRPFVEEMKRIWGDEAMRLFAMAQKLRPSKEWLRQQTCANLLRFNTFLRRLSSLLAVAPLLSEGSIKSVNDVFLSYSYELARLSPHPLLAPVSWRSIQILNFTAAKLCMQSTKHFPTCAEVEAHFALIISRLEAWPRYERSRDFARLTAFSLLPRMLNAEAHVEKWLPFAQDPSGNIQFLFDEFLLHEIEKEQSKLNRSLDSLSKRWTKSSARKYLNIAAALTIVMAGTLTLLIIISVLFFFFFFFYLNSGTGSCETRCSGARKAPRVPKIASSHLLCIALSTTLLCALGVAFGVVGSLGQSQLCDVVLARPQHADVWLDRVLASLLPRIPGLREVLQIEHINLQLPRRVFTTLNANYTPDSPPFLQSIGMSRPANLSALLHSDWLNKTLHDLWYKKVWYKMEHANLSYRIPRVPLSKTFNHFRRAVKLDQTFDDLYVGNITEYLPEPSNDYYTRIGLALRTISKRGFGEVDQLANYFTTIGNLIALYKLKFDQIAQALVVIEDNKRILEPLSPLIDVGDRIMGYLANKTNFELVSQFTNNTAEIFINSRHPVDQYVLPLIHRIFDRLFPYPSLGQTYRSALSPICPADPTRSPLFLTLKKFGFTLSLSAFGLFVVSILCHRIPLKA